jgi:hypothetical protein
MSLEVMTSRKQFISGPTCLVILLLLAVFAFSHGSRAAGQEGQKTAEGKVVQMNGSPQSGAIVYLKNEKTNDIKSFISVADGSYRFGQLSSDIDYEVWAEYQGRKSPVKTVSAFDSRKKNIYELKIGDGK